jgi:hydrogenase/urease accessory protein HupE
MEMIIGYLLIIVGVAMEIISVLVWLGVLKPASENAALQSVTFWDVLLELTKRAPWPAVVGLLNIYAGLKLIGVSLPF